jgi:hypothetical protein
MVNVAILLNAELADWAEKAGSDPNTLILISAAIRLIR